MSTKTRCFIYALLILVALSFRLFIALKLPTDEPGILVGSLGTLELSLRGESLAARWAIRRGAAVRVEVPIRGGDAAAPRPA